MKLSFATSSLALWQLLLLPFAAGATAPAHDQRLTGIWYTEDQEGAVEIYPCDTALCGKLVWFKPSAAPKAALDERNPNPELQGQSLCGLQFMGGFTRQPDGSYSSGWIYSPRHGATFSASLKPGATRDELTVRGYVVFSLFGESQTWRRAGALTPCQQAVQDPAANIAK